MEFSLVNLNEECKSLSDKISKLEKLLMRKESIQTEDVRTQLETLDSQLDTLLSSAQSLDKKKEVKPILMFASKKKKILTNINKEKANLAKCRKIIDADACSSIEENADSKWKSMLAKILPQRSRSSSPVKVVEEKLAKISALAVSSEKKEEIVDYDELADIPVDSLTLEAIEKYKKNKPKKLLSAEKERDILALVNELEKSFEESESLQSTSARKSKSLENETQENDFDSPVDEEDDADTSQADALISTDADSEYEVIQQWSSQEEGDLSVNVGEILHVFKKRDDGWWSAVNRKEKQGLVPSNFLAPAKKIITASDAKTASAKPPSQSDVSEVEEVEAEVFSEEEAAVAEEPIALPLLTAGNDKSITYEGAKDTGSKEDTEEGGDSATLLLSPFPLEQEENKMKGSSLAKSEPSLKQTTMKSNESLPLGLHLSTLEQWETEKYSLGHWLQPQLDSSGLHLADLAFDASTSKIVPRPGHWQRVITIQKVANLSSLPKTDLIEIKKCVRVCLCDGKTVVSNVYQMALSPPGSKGATYTVNPLIIDPAHRSAELSDIFVRNNSARKDYSILFEVAATVRKLNSEETLDIGCGWATLPAYQEDGNPIQNKVFELELTPGAPMEKKTRFSTDLPRVGSASRRVASQLPKIVVRLSAPNRRQLGYLDSLPDILIGGCGYLALLVFYRELMAEELKTNRASSAAIIRHLPPVLASFPDVINSPLLLEALRVTWNIREKSFASSARAVDMVGIDGRTISIKAHPRLRSHMFSYGTSAAVIVSQQRDSVVARRTFSVHFLRAIYPLTSVRGLIPENSDQPEIFAKASKRVLELARQCEVDPLSVLLSDTWDHKPLRETQLVLPIRAH